MSTTPGYLLGLAAVAIIAFLLGRWTKGRGRDPREIQLDSERGAADTEQRLTSIPPEMRAEIDVLIRAQAKIHAIKLVHEKFAWGLKASKDVIDARERQLGL